ncbi:MAG: SdrD B-like domain-containing protein, partial [Solirubrobacterales bacterium]
MLLSQLRTLVARLRVCPPRQARHRRAPVAANFKLDPLEPRLLLSVTGGAMPTVDFTDYLNGPANDNPDYNMAIDVNGALYTNDANLVDFVAGSGSMQSFVRISANATSVQGYNTSGRGPGNTTQYDENKILQYTHNLPLDSIPWSYIDTNGDGTQEAYRVFRLDINETNTDAGRWLSLDTIQIWQSDTASLVSGFVPAAGDNDQTDYSVSPTIGFTTGATGNCLAYSLDAGATGNWIAFNYGLNPGSGRGDMVLLVPSGYFNSNLDYVYFYSQFGAESQTSDIDTDGDDVADLFGITWGQDDGFEEWDITEGGPADKVGIKFLDQDTDGVREPAGADNIAGNADDEVGLSGWTIYAYKDENLNGVLDTGEGLCAQTTTSATASDLNGDGVKDAGDLPLSGWTISAFVDANADDVLQQTEIDAGAAATDVTDAAGAYSLTLDPGDYIVVETLAAKWFESPDDDATQVNPNGLGSSKHGYAITLVSGEQKNELGVFANFLNGSIHGFKFEDVDANGHIDDADTAMSGVTMELTGDADGDGTVDTVQVATNAAGKFSYLGLHPGTYTITELFTDGSNWAATVDHNDDGIGDNTTTVTVQSGEELVAFEGDAGLGADDPRTEVVVGCDLIFGNHELGAYGLTPGFWSTHLYLWDGIDNNGPTDSQGGYLADKLAADGVC